MSLFSPHLSLYLSIYISVYPFIYLNFYTSILNWCMYLCRVFGKYRPIGSLRNLFRVSISKKSRQSLKKCYCCAEQYTCTHLTISYGFFRLFFFMKVIFSAVDSELFEFDYIANNITKSSMATFWPLHCRPHSKVDY